MRAGPVLQCGGPLPGGSGRARRLPAAGLPQVTPVARRTVGAPDAAAGVYPWGGMADPSSTPAAGSPRRRRARPVRSDDPGRPGAPGAPPAEPRRADRSGLFDTLVRLLPDAVFSVRANGRLGMWSAAAARLTGRRRWEVHRRGFATLFTSQRANDADEPVARR